MLDLDVWTLRNNATVPVPGPRKTLLGKCAVGPTARLGEDWTGLMLELPYSAVLTGAVTLLWIQYAWRVPNLHRLPTSLHSTLPT